MLRYATILLGFTACYEPTFENCHVVCGGDTDCAPGHVCDHGMCTSGESCEVEADAAPPPAVAGRYAMTLTNRENGCAFPNWMEGESSAFDVVMATNGDVVTAEPQGAVAGFLDAWLGSHTWAGEQVDDRLALVLAGVKKNKQGKCEFTFDAAFDAAIDGDTLRGDLTYVARTNGHADCMMLTGCTTRSQLRAVRAAE